MNDTLITLFTPSFADEENTNAQNLTAKEIVARLPPDQFRVVMICGQNPDPRLARRKNTHFVRWTAHGNTLRLFREFFRLPPDIYFFPRFGPFDRAFLNLRRFLPIRTRLVTYVVMMMNETTAAGLPDRTIREADRVCSNSAFVADTVRRRFGLSSQTIHDGVDRRFFFPSSARESAHRLTVLYAGSFQARKRVELVVEQAARWPGVHFRLAGQGETAEHCRALSRQYACQNISFLGHLSQVQLGEEMRKADVFLFPSILEGHPQVLIQAAACGLPAVAMNFYRPDSVVDGQTGFLVHSDGEMAERFDRLLWDQALRKLFSEAAVKHADAFDWDRIAQQWIEVFQTPVHDSGVVRRACAA